MTATAIVSFCPAAARAKGCSPLVIGVLLGLFPFHYHLFSLMATPFAPAVCTCIGGRL